MSHHFKKRIKITDWGAWLSRLPTGIKEYVALLSAREISQMRKEYLQFYPGRTQTKDLEALRHRVLPQRVL